MEKADLPEFNNFIPFAKNMCFFVKSSTKIRLSVKSMYARNMFKISNTCIILSFSHFMKWLEQILSHFMKWLEYFSHFMKWLNELAISRNG